ncbi:MAG: tryptophan synthase subunit alpha [Gemmatimonadetes bacterium]|nr:tryptophan synthase subunit alpha [Gemmatimonadota bacterium]MYB57809.1 tryptophan synthase subunit alpha [Gemmatimonadota bacterium]
MMRIGQRFEDLRKADKTGFVAYITAGDPDLNTTHQVVLELDRRGVDVLELGVPFSDPLADGPVIQEASQRALAAGATLDGVLSMVADVRMETEIPIVLFTYYNPIHRYGVERFVKRAADVGVDGVLMLDLPPEEGGDYKAQMDVYGLDTIFLVTPTTRDDRMKLIASHTRGFVYYVSRTGVTGERDSLADEIQSKVSAICQHTDMPIAVGFGISTPEHVSEIARYADAVVVGSAIVRRIGEYQHEADLVAKVGAFVGSLIGPLREGV